MTVYETAGASVGIPKREVFRYLGYRGIAPDETILGRVEEAVQKLQKESHPRSAWNVFPLELSASSPDDIQIESLHFSPGYGDVPLDLQKDFSALLQMPQTCGISLTDTLLMVPSKSVTAFIGFSEHKEPCILAGCETCSHATDCAFRR